MRVVLFAPNWLGDAVMALPAIADIRRGMPGAALDVVARPSVAPLFGLTPGPGAVIEAVDRRHLADSLQRQAYDVAILFPNSFASALAAERAGILERWGYRGQWRAPLLTRAVPPPRSVHQSEFYQHLVRALGFPSGPCDPTLVLADDRRQAGRELLERSGWDGRIPLVAMAPGAAFGGAKRWPAKNFAALAKNLGNDGAVVVLTGAAADRAAADELLAALAGQARPIDLVGRTDLCTLTSVFAHCRALVTNDSGAMHVAAALGLDVIALFGPTRERETAPLGRGRRQILTTDVWCRPCMLRECPLTHRCMTEIAVARVHEAVRPSL